MKHTEPIAQISGNAPEVLAAPSSGSEYHRLEHTSDDLRGPQHGDSTPPSMMQSVIDAVVPDHDTSAPSAPTMPNFQMPPTTTSSPQGSQGYEPDEDTALYDVILFGIAGVVIVMILEQFVQMGVALQAARFMRR